MIDWFAIINDLERAKFSLEEIGTRVGLNASTIHRYKVGSEPRYSVGQQLLHLHYKFCVDIAESQRFIAERKTT